MVIARAMCAELHGEDSMCNGDVFHLVSAVENENALLVLALELVFKGPSTLMPSPKTSAATPCDAATGLAACLQHGIG